MMERKAAVQAAPSIELRQVAAEQAGPTGEWRVGFLLENQGAGPLEILTARLPHGQFRGDEQHFVPPARLAPGEAFAFATRVCCKEPPGLVSENAFVIFLVDWVQARWRIFVRIRVVVDTAGTPLTKTESITTQKVGFSGIEV